MTTQRSPEYLRGLVAELRKQTAEAGWVEFKENNTDPHEIGEYVSALSNTAALKGKESGYLVWGIQDSTHEVVGTTFQPELAKKGNEDLGAWLTRAINPQLPFHFYEVPFAGKRVVILEIPRAFTYPVQFNGVEYVRVGSYKKKLKDYREMEAALWKALRETLFETMCAAEHVSATEVLDLLDYPAYFSLLHKPLPSDRAAIMARLAEDGLVRRDSAGAWDISNLGAILFARDLGRFPGLSRKAVRVIEYEGRNRMKTRREQVGVKGYAAGFSGLIEYINALVPRNEVIGQALREEVPMYPELAIRELVANALIHQDLTLTGTGPMVEIFSDRLEITNPGRPLVAPDRFLGAAPRSRNEALAAFMRRIGVCEERGSGIYKVVSETERYQLPAPLFETIDDATRVVLFAHKAFRDMGREDRLRACYLHTCLRYMDRDAMTNASLRQRFGIEERNSAQVSRIIKDTLEAGLIKPYDPEQKNKRLAKYVPVWA